MWQFYKRNLGATNWRRLQCEFLSLVSSRAQAARDYVNNNNNNNNNNKRDIIIHDNEKGTCMLIDVAISGDRNVIKKEAEKILKYKDLTIEIQCMWNVKTKVIPVIIGATGTISKSFRKYASNIPGNHEVKEIQKTAILALHTYFGRY